MAAPNLANISTITAKIKAAQLGTTVTTNILENTAGSGKVFKINTILIPNVDGSNSATATVYYHDGTTRFGLINTIEVPADSTLVALDKNSVLYLEEGTRIEAGANASNDLDILISYEELS